MNGSGIVTLLSANTSMSIVNGRNLSLLQRTIGPVYGMGHRICATSKTARSILKSMILPIYLGNGYGSVSILIIPAVHGPLMLNISFYERFRVGLSFTGSR